MEGLIQEFVDNDKYVGVKAKISLENGAPEGDSVISKKSSKKSVKKKNNFSDEIRRTPDVTLDCKSKIVLYCSPKSRVPKVSPF